MKGGVPQYDKKFLKAARVLCMLGATDVNLAHAFSVNRHTIMNWRKVYPEFAEACQEGKDHANLMVLRSLYRCCIGFSKQGKYYKPDVTAIIWWMKNRMDWRDKPEGEKEPEDVLREIADGIRLIREADGI